MQFKDHLRCFILQLIWLHNTVGSFFGKNWFRIYCQLQGTLRFFLGSGALEDVEIMWTPPRRI